LVLLAPWLELPSTALDGTAGARIPTLREIATLDTTWQPMADAAALPAAEGETVDLRRLLAQGAAHAASRIAAIDEIARVAGVLAVMDYTFLFDKVRRQLVVGYNVDHLRCDDSYYDLLASEARLCNFVAIAQGQVPQESWFALGRRFSSVAGDPVLLAWSGSMFEYLMPLLVMPTYENSLLDQT